MSPVILPQFSAISMEGTLQLPIVIRYGTCVQATRVNAQLQWVHGVAFTPDGKGLVSGSGDNTQFRARSQTTNDPKERKNPMP